MRRPQIIIVDPDQIRFKTLERLLQELIPNYLFTYAGSARVAVDASEMFVPPNSDFPAIAAFIHGTVPAGGTHSDLRIVAGQGDIAPAAGISLMLQAKGILPQRAIIGVATTPEEVARLADTHAFGSVVTDNLFTGGPEMLRSVLPELFSSASKPHNR